MSKYQARMADLLNKVYSKVATETQEQPKEKTVVSTPEEKNEPESRTEGVCEKCGGEECICGSFEEEEKSELNEITVSMDKVNKAQRIAKKMAGNMTGAIREIEKIMKGLSDVKFVKKALADYNEDKELEENLDVRYDTTKKGWFDKQGKRRYLGIGQTNALMKKALDKAIKSGDWINPFKMKHGQKAEDLELQERAPRRGDWQVNSQKKDTPIKNIDHFATKKQADDFAAKVKKDGGKVDSITQLEAVEEQFTMTAIFNNGDKVKFKGKSDSDIRKQVKDYEKKNYTGLQHDGPLELEMKEELDEGIMSDIDRLSKSGKSADEIAKELKLDVKAVKSVLGETIKIVPVQKSGLPPHLKKLFDKDGNFIDPRSQAKWDKFVKDSGGSDAMRKKYNIYKKEDGSVELREFTDAQIKTLEKEYAPLKGKRMSTDMLNRMMGMIKKMSKSQLNKLAQANVPFVTSTAKSELVINRGMKWSDFKESLNNLKKESTDSETSTATVVKKSADKEQLKQDIEKLEKENQLLKVKNLEKTQKTVEPNKDTGEVPLKVGLAQKILKDMRDGKKPKKIKEKETNNLKGVGTGKTKIEIDPKMNISASAGGDGHSSSN